LILFGRARLLVGLGVLLHVPLGKHCKARRRPFFMAFGHWVASEIDFPLEALRFVPCRSNLPVGPRADRQTRSEEHTSELQSLTPLSLHDALPISHPLRSCAASCRAWRTPACTARQTLQGSASPVLHGVRPLGRVRDRFPA